ncbi:medium-chain-fatty-acid--CoA ligase, partial [mine drainage metagenome]
MLYGNSKILNFDGENVVEFTYTQVAKRAHALSGALRDLGVGKDDRVATFCFNHNQHLEAYLAIPSM